MRLKQNRVPDEYRKLFSMVANTAKHTDDSGVKRSPFVFRLLSFFSGIVLFAVILAFIFSAVGFVRYTWNVMAQSEVELTQNHDGIVVLTGGADRISTGLELLKNKRASKMLISGVHPDTTKAAIAETVGQPTATLSCCVDIGRVAANTVGNAKEANAWAKKNGFASLLMVTSDYHVPRAMLEMSMVMDGISVKAYPVGSPLLQEKEWYRNPDAWKLLFEEYAKYFAVRVGQLPAILQARVEALIPPQPQSQPQSQPSANS